MCRRRAPAPVIAAWIPAPAAHPAAAPPGSAVRPPLRGRPCRPWPRPAAGSARPSSRRASGTVAADRRPCGAGVLGVRANCPKGSALRSGGGSRLDVTAHMAARRPWPWPLAPVAPADAWHRPTAHPHPRHTPRPHPRCRVGKIKCCGAFCWGGVLDWEGGGSGGDRRLPQGPFKPPTVALTTPHSHPTHAHVPQAPSPAPAASAWPSRAASRSPSGSGSTRPTRGHAGARASRPGRPWPARWWTGATRQVRPCRVWVCGGFRGGMGRAVGCVHGRKHRLVRPPAAPQPPTPFGSPRISDMYAHRLTPTFTDTPPCTRRNARPVRGGLRVVPPSRARQPAARARRPVSPLTPKPTIPPAPLASPFRPARHLLALSLAHTQRP